jgi:hypothetical protein
VVADPPVNPPVRVRTKSPGGHVAKVTIAEAASRLVSVQGVRERESIAQYVASSDRHVARVNLGNFALRNFSTEGDVRPVDAAVALISVPGPLSGAEIGRLEKHGGFISDVR